MYSLKLALPIAEVPISHSTMLCVTLEATQNLKTREKYAKYISMSLCAIEEPSCPIWVAQTFRQNPGVRQRFQNGVVPNFIPKQKRTCTPFPRRRNLTDNLSSVVLLFTGFRRLLSGNVIHAVHRYNTLCGSCHQSKGLTGYPHEPGHQRSNLCGSVTRTL